MGLLELLTGRKRDCFPGLVPDPAEEAKRSNASFSDQLADKFRDKVGNTQRYDENQRTQFAEAAKRLDDLKQSDPAAYDKLGAAIRTNRSVPMYDVLMGAGGIAQGEPGALKQVLEQVITTPDNASQIMNDNYRDEDVREYPEPSASTPATSSSNAGPAAALPAPQPAARSAAYTLPSNPPPAAPVESRLTATLAASPGVAVTLSSIGGNNGPNSAFEALGNEKPPLPTQPGANGLFGNGMEGLMQMIAALASMFSGGGAMGPGGGMGGGDLMQTLGQVFEKMGADFGGSTGLKVQGDNLSMVQNFAGMTNANPVVIAVDSSGQERNLGPAQSLETNPAVKRPTTPGTVPAAPSPAMGQ